MKSIKQLQEIYNKAKGDNHYYKFIDFQRDVKEFIKDVKTRQTYCSIKASSGGMSRKFNFNKYNMLLNICYNEKFFWDYVYVGGCRMNMHWYLKFRTCQMLMTKKEVEKYNINFLCSSGIIL
jgi:hypothetical protein